MVNNIANVNTEGYVRQDLALQEGLPTKNGLFFLGSGAIADGVRRAYDGQIESSLRISISDLNAQSPLIENTERLINVFGNKNASLTPALGGFFDGLRALSVDASSEVLRTQVINDGQTLAARFNGLASQLDALDFETRQLATDKINAFNALAEQLASINANLEKPRMWRSNPPICWMAVIRCCAIWRKLCVFPSVRRRMARFQSVSAPTFLTPL